MQTNPENHLLDSLAKEFNCRHAINVAKNTWFSCGGVAKVLFRPQDEHMLIAFLQRLNTSRPISVLGLGSNVLIRDGGIPGVVIKLGKNFNFMRLIDSCTIEVGGLTPDYHITEFCIANAIGGLEFLSTIPGTIGGNIRMNAGCYKKAISDVLVSFTAVDYAGNIKEFDTSQINFGYRENPLEKDLIFTKAILRGYPRDKSAIQADIEAMRLTRNKTQPCITQTGGSTFMNPINRSETAWELIDQCGLRGLQVGGAQISPKHCNFIINTGNATAADIEAIGELARHHVRNTFDITLQWEIVRMGDFPIHVKQD